MAKHTPVFADRPETAAAELHAMAPSKEIALDTEGASFHRFVDRIYLLQMSTRGRSAIIDPLNVTAEMLAPLGAMLEDQTVQVVFHDADYDLRLLHSDYGWHVRNIFDTRVAAQLLGLKAFGLAALLERYFGVKLDKKHQRADWSMRPLTADMLDYAAQDTLYLLELRDRISDELKAKDRMPWAAEEFARLEGTKWDASNDDEAFLRIKGARDLSRRELAVLRELAPWRDSVAREQDRATFRVIGNEQLLEIAKVQPRSREEISRIKGVSRGVLDRQATAIVDAVSRGLVVPEGDLPKFPKSARWDRDPKFDTKVNALKGVRDVESQRLDMDPGVLFSRDRMEAVARKNPKTVDELLEVPEVRRWQAELMGEGFVAALAKI